MTDWQKRCEYLKTKIKALEFYKDDIENATRMALDERCSLDQKHCTCVPLLRFENTRLQAANADLKTTYKKLWESHRETAIKLAEAEAEARIKPIEKQQVILTGNVSFDKDLPFEFTNVEIGDILIQRGWPHIVIDAGAEQGKRIAAFREPFGWSVRGKAAEKD